MTDGLHGIPRAIRSVWRHALDAAWRMALDCVTWPANRAVPPEKPMPNETHPSNGAADLRLSDDARAVLETLRSGGAPLSFAGVYCFTKALPINGQDRCEDALNELIARGYAREIDGEYEAVTTPPQPERPYTDAQRAAVLDALTHKSQGVYEVLGRSEVSRCEPYIGVAYGVEILADLVADGAVVRTVRDGRYVYALSEPPLPTLPTLRFYERRWLQAIRENEPLDVTCIPEGADARITLAAADLVTEAPNNTYRLTDLGRRVLAAAEREA